jgi:hypothetical protein
MYQMLSKTLELETEVIIEMDTCATVAGRAGDRPGIKCTPNKIRRHFYHIL